MVRFSAALDDYGNWGVFDHSSGYMLGATRYPDLQAAELFAERLNAIAAGEPMTVVEDLRSDSDQLR